MKVYLLTDEDIRGLIDQLELHRMREQNLMSPDSRPEEDHLYWKIDNVHRAFHMVAIRWAQAHGWTRR